MEPMSNHFFSEIYIYKARTDREYVRIIVLPESGTMELISSIKYSRSHVRNRLPS